MGTIKERFLRKLYESTGGKVDPVNMYQIGKELGFDRDLTKNIVQKLEEKGLVISYIGSEKSGSISITPEGVRKVKEA